MGCFGCGAASNSNSNSNSNSSLDGDGDKSRKECGGEGKGEGHHHRHKNNNNYNNSFSPAVNIALRRELFDYVTRGILAALYEQQHPTAAAAAMAATWATEMTAARQEHTY
jgi:hypothetical protein